MYVLVNRVELHEVLNTWFSPLENVVNGFEKMSVIRKQHDMYES